jgi:hypothetical protein
MAEVRKVRTDGANYDLVFPENVSSVYADGVAVAALGVPISRIVFYTVSTPSDEQSATETESRKVCLELSMPMGAMLELAKHILDGVKENQNQIASAFETYKNGIIENINS